MDLLVLLIHRDLSDLGSVILFRIIPKERTLRNFPTNVTNMGFPRKCFIEYTPENLNSATCLNGTLSYKIEDFIWTRFCFGLNIA